MRRMFLAFVVVVASSPLAMAVQFPVLAVPSAVEGYLDFSQSSDSSEITLATKAGYEPYVSEAGAVGDLPSEILGNDYTLTTTLDYGSNTAELGLIARATGISEGTATTNMYTTTIDPNNKFFVITKTKGGQWIANYGDFYVEDFDAEKDYTLTFTVNGSSLSASLYGEEGLIHTILATDDEFTGGQIGVFARKKTASTISGTWLNSSVTAVPEPGTVAMLAAGVFASLAWAGLRRR